MVSSLHLIFNQKRDTIFQNLILKIYRVPKLRLM